MSVSAVDSAFPDDSEPDDGSSRDVLHRVLVIAVGNPYRCDDGVAAAVVEAIEPDESRLSTMVCDGELFTLPLCWSDTDDVVIVDACKSGHPPGTIVELDPDEIDSLAALSTHGFGVVDAMRIARHLGLVPWRLRVFGIEGHDFGHGPLSGELRAAVPRLADQLVAMLVPSVGPEAR